MEVRLCGNKSRSTPDGPSKRPRGWRVIIIRSKGEYLGSVEAPDRLLDSSPYRSLLHAK